MRSGADGTLRRLTFWDCRKSRWREVRDGWKIDKLDLEWLRSWVAKDRNSLARCLLCRPPRPQPCSCHSNLPRTPSTRGLAHHSVGPPTYAGAACVCPPTVFGRRRISSLAYPDSTRRNSCARATSVGPRDTDLTQRVSEARILKKILLALWRAGTCMASDCAVEEAEGSRKVYGIAYPWRCLLSHLGVQDGSPEPQLPALLGAARVGRRSVSHPAIRVPK